MHGHGAAKPAARGEHNRLRKATGSPFGYACRNHVIGHRASLCIIARPTGMDQFVTQVVGLPECEQVDTGLGQPAQVAALVALTPDK